MVAADFFHDSMQVLETGEFPTSVGVFVDLPHTSQLDGKEYVYIQMNIVRPWAQGIRVNPCLAEEWREVAAKATEDVIGWLDKVIEDLAGHKKRLEGEASRLRQEGEVS